MSTASASALATSTVSVRASPPALSINALASTPFSAANGGSSGLTAWRSPFVLPPLPHSFHTFQQSGTSGGASDCSTLSSHAHSQLFRPPLTPKLQVQNLTSPHLTARALPLDQSHANNLSDSFSSASLTPVHSLNNLSAASNSFSASQSVISSSGAVFSFSTPFVANLSPIGSENTPGTFHFSIPATALFQSAAKASPASFAVPAPPPALQSPGSSSAPSSPAPKRPGSDSRAPTTPSHPASAAPDAAPMHLPAPLSLSLAMQSDSAVHPNDILSMFDSASIQSPRRSDPPPSSTRSCKIRSVFAHENAMQSDGEFNESAISKGNIAANTIRSQLAGSQLSEDSSTASSALSLSHSNPMSHRRLSSMPTFGASSGFPIAASSPLSINTSDEKDDDRMDEDGSKLSVIQRLSFGRSPLMTAASLATAANSPTSSSASSSSSAAPSPSTIPFSLNDDEETDEERSSASDKHALTKAGNSSGPIPLILPFSPANAVRALAGNEGQFRALQADKLEIEASHPQTDLMMIDKPILTEEKHAEEPVAFEGSYQQNRRELPPTPLHPKTKSRISHVSTRPPLAPSKLASPVVVSHTPKKRAGGFRSGSKKKVFQDATGVSVWKQIGSAHREESARSITVNRTADRDNKRPLQALFSTPEPHAGSRAQKALDFSEALPPSPFSSAAQRSAIGTPIAFHTQSVSFSPALSVNYSANSSYSSAAISSFSASALQTTLSPASSLNASIAFTDDSIGQALSRQMTPSPPLRNDDESSCSDSSLMQISVDTAAALQTNGTVEGTDFTSPVSSSRSFLSASHARASNEMENEDESNRAPPLSPKSRLRQALSPDPKAFAEPSVLQRRTPKMHRYPPTMKVPPTPTRLKRPTRLERTSSLYDSKILVSFIVEPPHSGAIFDKEFTDQHFVGEGSFFGVYRCKEKRTGQTYAVKRSLRSFKGKKDRESYLQEVLVVHGLGAHDNIIKHYRAWQEQLHFFIQMEFCPYNLAEFVENMDRAGHALDDAFLLSVAQQMASALSRIHQGNIVHLDVKPSNVLVSPTGVLKLADFGQAKMKMEITDAAEGDSVYMAPELLIFTSDEKRTASVLTPAADIFSLGLMLFEFASGLELPRTGTVWHELREGNARKYFTPGRVSAAMEDFIVSLISPKPEDRPTADQILARVRERKREMEIAKHANGNGNGDSGSEPASPTHATSLLLYHLPQQPATPTESSSQINGSPSFNTLFSNGSSAESAHAASETLPPAQPFSS